MSEKDWVTQVEEEIERIKKWKVEDRLSAVAKLTFMNGTVASSVTGWNSWLTNALVMEKFTEEELKELAKEFQELALAFLELDIKYTKLMKEKQAEAEKVKKEAEVEEVKKRTTKYVA